MGQKRRRLALSCVACRRRKVKCDRTFPTCVRCQKGSINCDYVTYTSQQNTAFPTPSEESPQLERTGSVDSWAEEANEWHERSRQHENPRPQEDKSVPPAPAPVSRPPTRTLQELQERISSIETYVKVAGSRPVSSETHLRTRRVGAHEDSPDKDAPQNHDRALLRGKGFKTQYFGPSHAASLLLQFEELSFFTKDILQRLPTFKKTREIFKRHRRETRQAFVLPDSETLVSLIPDRPSTDARVQEYFETMETTYRVLHAPTFFQKYKGFWASSSDTSSDFLVQLLLVCACVNCIVPDGPTGFFGTNSVRRGTAIKWIEVCETWLDLQSQKHMTLEIYQVQVLLVIAKKFNCVKVKREWTVAGHLLRLAMSNGLHREPSYLSTSISVFDQEMRRRLWFTILELEVQASLDRGMGASLGPFDWDCLAPLNIHDEDFDQNTEKMPDPRPVTTFTRTSFLCLAQQHLPLRLEILSKINSIRAPLDTDSVIELDQRLRQILDALPRWTDPAAKAMSCDLSELLLYELLLLIHQPFAAQAKGQTRHFYSRVACRGAALTTLKKYKDMRPTSTLTFSGLRSDLLRASLALCHDIVLCTASTEDLMQDKNMPVTLIEQAVDIMEVRLRRLGQGFHAFWLTCSALALIQAKMWPAKPAEERAQETADRVVKLHDYMMEQQTPPTPLASGSGLEDAAMSTASTLMGLSGQPVPAQVVPELDPFAPMAGHFNVFSDTLFDFDMPDIWGMGGNAQLQ
ncbi:hypothetical protein A1O1_04328 [Capronia coronata CBS 617.96]|uniref:Zn(2)-C6 fungal-type domain-containing protein n=1 Tax=Capronia coronata CBS 617.96 TaxID=1182541 RepID=W9YF86_9EURO|nr:uncharacterized protein A1O1_04328 [Capronia coronata CBS 617.96]EXJ91218.1 hypothetical protein A1O1_04328 [Capronia coronata CBS 617.96]